MPSRESLITGFGNLFRFPPNPSPSLSALELSSWIFWGSGTPQGWLRGRRPRIAQRGTQHGVRPWSPGASSHPEGPINPTGAVSTFQDHQNALS